MHADTAIVCLKGSSVGWVRVCGRRAQAEKTTSAYVCTKVGHFSNELDDSPVFQSPWERCTFFLFLLLLQTQGRRSLGEEAGVGKNGPLRGAVVAGFGLSCLLSICSPNRVAAPTLVFRFTVSMAGVGNCSF